jgi:hypothetical protein
VKKLKKTIKTPSLRIKARHIENVGSRFRQPLDPESFETVSAARPYRLEYVPIIIGKWYEVQFQGFTISTLI